MSIPTFFGMELSVGDELGLADIPLCCEDYMAAEDTDSGKRKYTCEECGTVLTVSANGLVFDLEDVL